MADTFKINTGPTTLDMVGAMLTVIPSIYLSAIYLQIFVNMFVLLNLNVDNITICILNIQFRNIEITERKGRQLTYP